MADKLQEQVAKDSVQAFQMRSLYSMAGMQFVIPDPMVTGSYGVVPIPKEERTENDLDALVLDISSNGETVRKKLLGAKGVSTFSGNFQVGGLDFNMSY